MSNQAFVHLSIQWRAALIWWKTLQWSIQGRQAEWSARKIFQTGKSTLGCRTVQIYWIQAWSLVLFLGVSSSFSTARKARLRQMIHYDWKCGGEAKYDFGHEVDDCEGYKSSKNLCDRYAALWFMTNSLRWLEQCLSTRLIVWQWVICTKGL